MKRLVILGAGESGVGTAILGKKMGYDVFVSDYGVISEKYKTILNKYDLVWEEKQHTESLILNADIVMKSPGIPDKAPIVKKLNNLNVDVISEIEFAFPYTQAKTIGITGSNGKTTTTLLTYHLLKKGGLNVGLAGNIGKSFAWQVAEENFDYYVLELSSFQLDGIKKYKPEIAVLTNISPDHLDRYNYDYNQYIASKFRITMNQNQTDVFIYDADDIAINQWFIKNKTKARKIPFSLSQKIKEGIYTEQNKVISTIEKEPFMIERKTISLEGKHNVKNAMAAISVAQLLKIRKEKIKESLIDFEGPEHRLEKIKNINGVWYINDSKATNVNSVYYALECINAPIIWIAGGTDKGNDYTELMPLVREKVKAIICLGIDNQLIIDTFKNVVDTIIEVRSATDAVKSAQKLSEKGDNVLLSPACASFDLFKNYEDRGTQFKNAVEYLSNK